MVSVPNSMPISPASSIGLCRDVGDLSPMLSR
jgi:hypothetical protein